MPSYADLRCRLLNDRPVQADRRYVLYWMHAYRRLNHNHALDHAAEMARQLKKPLVVYEGLRFDYPWASVRLHQFILEGMRDNAARAAELGISYWPFVESTRQRGKGLLTALARQACLIVTDDFPAFIVPRQNRALAGRIDCQLVAVDGNGIVPLALLGAPVSAAAHLRPRIHRIFAEAWPHRATPTPDLPPALCLPVDPPFEIWNGTDVTQLITSLPIDQTIRPVAGLIGGSVAARTMLKNFLQKRLAGYAENRSAPVPPDQGHGSGLSAYLHFGHIAIEEVVAGVLGRRWSVKQLNGAARGKREGFYSDDADINAFLDEAITWRDVGYHWHFHRGDDARSLETALPAWALKTLTDHAADRREYLYSAAQLEAAETHDELWNAAQTELVHTGSIHNYLRMLWGKKVIEWTESPQEAYRILEHLNNKYAVDGRDPNSYTGILWCFGLFDRPWPPERRVFGTVRYMSSENTARKFKLATYMQYVAGLRRPT